MSIAETPTDRNERDYTELATAAVQRAEAWQLTANQLRTQDEKAIHKQLRRLLNHPLDKVIMAQMIDQSFRSSDDQRVADQIKAILHDYGVPEFFDTKDKLLMRLFLGVGRHFPHVSVPRVIERMREDSSHSVIPGEPEVLNKFLEQRRREGVRVNINHLGEAVLGEDEAQVRLATYIEDLTHPAIDYISVKISTIFSQIQPLAFEATVEILVQRLGELYRAAAANPISGPKGSSVAKFVNLDMEEYRDLAITVAAFTRTLAQPEFKNVGAGIVLQAYLPDSYQVQQELTAWARRRVTDGGAPIKIRIVKGANMEMELVDSALHNWPLAPYDNKLDVDANYKRMVAFGLQPDNIAAAHVGVASHNLFELAFAHQLARANGVADLFSFEMLEGMADHVRRAIQAANREVVIYAPVATKAQFLSAIAYLIRRLDENTGEENFLRYACELAPGTPEWTLLEHEFMASVARMAQAGQSPHRTQNRQQSEGDIVPIAPVADRMVTEADTDWSLAPNREWAQAICRRWQKDPEDDPLAVPIVVDGSEIFENRPQEIISDANQAQGTSPGNAVGVARYALAQPNDLHRAVAVARADPDGWRDQPIAARKAVLDRVARELRRARGDLIGAAAAGSGKIFTESDPEVSEAVDFAVYYPQSVQQFMDATGLTARGKGVGVVVAPWNFPIAIPCGGMTAALAAGNTVIFKPASDAVLPAWILVQCFWRAGISRKTLQFVPCTGRAAGEHLTAHPDVDFVIFTGGTDTGLSIQRARPDIFLAGETGGKNSTIVTAMSDRDQAINNVVQSAFGHGGQKCSATSLLILEKEVYRDTHFKQQLRDAARSLAVGSAWDFTTRLGPLIKPPKGDLHRGLTRLEPGEIWLLEPAPVDDNPHLWRPGIKWGVRADSFTYRTELFGPVLGVMEAADLAHALELANGTGYGLTAGLESLDVREQQYWKAHIEAGNLYINRGTTGAMVLRQPFGGMKKSALGAGIKVGGPNYVTQFMDFEPSTHPVSGPMGRDSHWLRVVQHWAQTLRWRRNIPFHQDLVLTVKAVESYLFWREAEFSRITDYFRLRGQDNQLRYLPAGPVIVRLHADDNLWDVLCRTAAGQIAGCPTSISLPKGLDNGVTRFLGSPEGRRCLRATPLRGESDDHIILQLEQGKRLRYGAPERVPREIYAAAAAKGSYIARQPVSLEGRLEMLQYVREQSICDTYHRYGNLGVRALVNGPRYQSS